MASSTTPLDLYVNVQTILRVYRSTPHTSTGQTPFQLISKAKVPVMFPSLQRSQQKNQEAQRSSGKIRKARTFQHGDSVLVYDTQTKLNSSGIVKNCKSNNSYIVTISGKEKHISGDVMRLQNSDNSVINRNMNFPKDISNSDINEPNNCEDLVISDYESDISDNESVIFCPSDNRFIENLPNPIENNVIRKR